MDGGDFVDLTVKMIPIVAQLSARTTILDGSASDVPAHGFLLSGIFY